MKDSIFKEKIEVKQNIIKQNECEDIDENVELIPLYFGPVFKKIFQNHRLLKRFITVELNLEKLNNQNLYYGKSILFNRYGPHVVKTSIIIKLDKIKPLVITFANIDYQKSNIDNSLYELNISDKVIRNKKVKIINRTKKDLKYFRKLYEKNINLERRNLLLVLLTSKTFKELYEIVSKIYNEEDTNTLIKAAIKASQNKAIRKQWEVYKYKI